MSNFMKKKVIAIMVACVLMFSTTICVTAEEADATGLTMFDDATWTDQGVVVATNPNVGEDVFVYAKISYLYNSDEWIWIHTYSHGIVDSGDVFYLDYSNVISAEGSYKVEFVMYELDPGFSDVDFTDAYTAPIFTYIAPDEMVGTATDLAWGDGGDFTWTAPANSSEAWLLLLGTVDETVVTSAALTIPCTPGITNSWNLSTYMTEAADYTVSVKSYSDDISLYQHGVESEYSDVYSTLTVSTEVADELASITTDITADSTTEEVSSAVDSVKDTFSDDTSKNELAIAMQTSDEVLTQIEELEDLYASASNIDSGVSVGDSVALDTSQISMVGAMLNANEGETVTLKIEEPAAEAKIDPDSSLYANTVQFSIDLLVGEATMAELDVPITITMPIPDGIDESALVILHYSADGSYESVLYKSNGDGTVSFTITHFSEFIFGEIASTTTDDTTTDDTTTDDTTTGDSTTSTSTTTVATDSATVAAWVPTTEEEYCLSFVDGIDPTFTANVAGNAYEVSVISTMQGPDCVAVFDAAKGDYTLARTYSILPYEQQVYAMDAVATITMDIPTDLLSDGRVFNMICVSEDGAHYVLEDLDANPNTITFSTNHFYAFALCYKG